jgi:transposase
MQDAMKHIRRLEAALGRTTLENEILKEVVECGKSRKLIARSPLLSGGEQ